jgi:probable rRNA maturation factor
MDPQSNAPSLEFVVESPLWAQHPGAEAVISRALQMAAAMQSTKSSELAIVLADDSAIRALNRAWRGIDKPTNVLSFPSVPWERTPGEPSPWPTHLGDIVIAFETAMQEAHSESKRFEDHIAHLAVHGFLHLLGQDHDNDSDADAMEGLERAILARLGIPDPYADRDLVLAARCDLMA